MLLDQILAFFSHYIETEIGVVYAQHNAFQLQNRLDEITKLLGVASVESLYEMAQSGISGSFKQLLLDVATNNETSFFRDAKVFKAVAGTVLKQAAEKNQPLKIWSAASSTGQEALSTSILINEENEKNGTNVHYSILGTDVSERALQRARSGSYSQLEVQRGMPAPLLIKYFRKETDERWAAKAEVTTAVAFRKINLKENFHFSEQFDLVFCRNVLIYQNVDQKIEILGRITKFLKTGGYLVLGSGESVIGLSNDYDTLNIDGAILYQKKVAA